MNLFLRTVRDDTFDDLNGARTNYIECQNAEMSKIEAYMRQLLKDLQTCLDNK